MFIKTNCPFCSKAAFHSISLHCLETTLFPDQACALRYAVEYIEVEDTVPGEAFAGEVLKTLKGYVQDGIEVRELCRILRNYYGVVAAYCCDIIQQIKIELDMYCPDREHLFFVEREAQAILG
jgi:hypothetical protein